MEEPVQERATYAAPGSQSPRMQEGRTRPGKKSWMWILIAIIAVVAIAAAAYMFMQPSGPVAVVNGEEISRSTYNARLEQAQTLLAQSGSDVNDAALQQQLQDQVLENLVTQELLLQEAAEAGITVTNAEVEEIVQQNKTQLETEEAYQQALQGQGFTESSFRDAIRTQLTVEKLLEARLNLEGITATEEEVQALYDQVAADTEDAPTLETVREQVEAEVIAQKRQQLINQFVQQLRQESDIEILI